MLSPIYASTKPAPDGSVPPGTGVLNGWDGVHPQISYGPLGRFYYYIWDMRLSPLDLTGDLRAYIEAVKAQTGAKKVVLASRCGGADMMAAYLSDYGWADIEKAIFFCNNLHGFNHADLTLSGNITVNGEAFNRWLEYEDKLAGFGLDEELYKFLMAMVSALDENGSIQDLADTVMKVYDKIKDPFIAPFLREYFGICGGYVANVGDHYAEYRDYIFPTDELKAEYANILAKADAFHYNVQLHAEDMLREMNASGTPVYLLVNYGEQMVAFGEKSSWVADVDALVSEQSFGATGARMLQTLSDSYIKARTDAGFGKYISPDRQIDASTGLFPDQTFYLKNLRHDYYTPCADYLVQIVAQTPGITVDTLPGLPQFLTCNEDRTVVSPAQAVNDADIDWAAMEEAYKPDEKTGFWVNTIAFFAKLFSVFRTVILRLKSLLGIA
ncbi:MAG: hypothetical protein IJK40_09050, partial [Clostridia bacterium]|nr:hypothetical protein [Clostridia bacterium]